MKQSGNNQRSLELIELEEGSYPISVTVKSDYPEPNGSEGKFEGNLLVYPGTKPNQDFSIYIRVLRDTPIKPYAF